MGRFDARQSSFAGGEISPRLRRGDMKQVQNSVQTASNAYSIPLGPMMKRPGTEYLRPNYDENIETRGYGFVSSAREVTVLEFGAGIIRFHDHDQLLTSVAAFTNGTFTTNLDGWTDASTGTGTVTQNAGVAEIDGGASGVGIMYQALSYIGTQQYTITADVTVGAITVKIGTTAGGTDIASGSIAVGTGSTFNFTTATAEDTVYVQFENPNNDTRTIDNVVLSTPTYTVESPYTEAELPDLWFAQSVDVLYIFHGDHVTRSLSSYAPAKWTLREIEYVDGPYYSINTESTKTLAYAGTLTAGATGTVTASGHSPFVSTDVGRLIRLGHATASPTNWGYAEITGFTSSTVVTVLVKEDIPSTAATKNWRLGVWSETTGYPSIGVFQEQRIACGNRGSNSQPVTVNLTEINGYDPEKLYFAPSSRVDSSVDDSNAIHAPLASTGANPIYWMVPGPILNIGTADAEWTISAGDKTRALSPTNFLAVEHTNRGSAKNVTPIKVSGSTLFIDRTKRTLREFVYLFDRNAYTAEDTSILADHILRQGVKRALYQQAPHSLVWLLLEDGSLVAFTYVDSQQVSGFSRHTISGTNVVVEDMIVIPSANLRYDEIWFLVKRTINGSVRRYWERLKEPFYLDVQAEHWGLDCSYQYNSTATDTITGLSHLEGETVSIYADGAVQPPATVSSGQITLAREYSTVLVGFSIQADIVTLPKLWEGDSPRAGRGTGTTMGRQQRITNLVADVFESSRFLTSWDGITYDESSFRTISGQTNVTTPLYSGFVDIPLGGRYNEEALVYIRHTHPGPFTLVQISEEGLVRAI